MQWTQHTQAMKPVCVVVYYSCDRYFKDKDIFLSYYFMYSFLIVPSSLNFTLNNSINYCYLWLPFLSFEVYIHLTDGKKPIWKAFFSTHSSPFNSFSFPSSIYPTDYHSLLIYLDDDVQRMMTMMIMIGIMMKRLKRRKLVEWVFENLQSSFLFSLLSFFPSIDYLQYHYYLIKEGLVEVCGWKKKKTASGERIE